MPSSTTRATSRASSTTSAKLAARIPASRANVPKDFEKFDIPEDEVDTFITEAESASSMDDAFAQRAIRLYILENGKDGGYTTLVKGCREAGLRFRDKILELGINFRKADRDSIETWDEKEAGKYFLDVLKERRREYNRGNASDDDAGMSTYVR